jgi:hypothetical protein
MIKKITLKNSVLLIIAFAMLSIGILVAGANVGAESGQGEGGTISPEKMAEIEKKKKERASESEKKMKERKSELESKKSEMEAKRSEVKEKFTEKRLEKCKEREARINEKMKKISERKAKQVEVFNKIAERTMTFYEENNLTLANYDALVADVVAKRGIADAEIENLKNTTVDFKCDSEDPLKVSEAFKTARESVKKAMKDYKTSVKNLIVGVKSVTPSTESESSEGEQS